LLEEVDTSGNLLARYTQTRSLDEELSELRSGTASYYEQDGVGSITSLSNPTGVLANTYTYDSYGKLTASTGTTTNPFRYTGRELDAETGIYEYRARYYDAQIGRFISEDPIRFQAGTGFYEYVFNNPLLWTDPRGLQVQICTKYWHPHTFICVDGNCSGKYPSGNPFWSPGQIRNDSSNKAKAQCGNVMNNSPCLEQCVANHIRQRGPSNDMYDFVSANCGQWAEDVVTDCRAKCSK
jgi:RHS repeat-associated protein